VSERLRVAKAYEAALFAGRMEEVGRHMADDVVYWVAGRPPLGGEWRGRDAVLQAFERREFGLGAGDWGYEDLERSWYEAEDRVIVEIREHSWLKSAPADVLDQRTCVVIRFRGGLIAELRDYTDTAPYEGFVARHRDHLPKFAEA
jgi:ketosteroid isomerase-like protein